MPDAIESVESERCRQYDLGGILDRVRESRDDLQHMDRVESSRSGKVCQEVAVHHWNKSEAEIEAGAFCLQTLRPTPVSRLAMEESHVNWGW